MPLASILRPQELESVMGQKHLVGHNKPITNIYNAGTPLSMIFYGPPGTGKTTVALQLATRFKLKLCKANGTSLNTSDLRYIISTAETSQEPVLLLLDEIQYLNKKQQQPLLEMLESGKLVLIATTTENPYFSVYNAILSRCLVFEFKALSLQDLADIVHRVLSILNAEGTKPFKLSDEVCMYLCRNCCGDARKLMNALELLYIMYTPDEELTVQDAESVLAKSYSVADGDAYYDTLSALQKSIRGSDPDAALHYTARLLMSNNLEALCRRLLVIASEDVGLAYPQAISITAACVEAAKSLGMPEARIPISEAVILLSTSPKSNSAIKAIDAAMDELHLVNPTEVPRILQNNHYDGADKYNSHRYLYPHDYPGHYVKQQYMPDPLAEHVYYVPCENKFETAAAEYLTSIKTK